MKIKFVVLSMLFSGAVAVNAQSNVFSINVVGYVNRSFFAGDNLFANPLSLTNNSLSYVIPSAPQGTAISLWDPLTKAFTQTSVFNAGLWSQDFTLLPGQGARLNSPAGFTNTFVGGVLMPDGSPNFVEPPFPLPPVFDGVDGIYLMSCKTPVQLSGNDIFRYIFGRLPDEGEQVMTFDPLAQNYQVTTYSSGVWDGGDPLLRVGDAAFFNIGPLAGDLSPSMVPEPSCVQLGMLGILGLLVFRRRR